MKVNRVSLLNARNSASNAFSTFSSNIQNTQNVREFSKSAGMGVTSLGMSQVSKPYAVLSFCGNKNQVAFIGAELPPYCKAGGVGTVMNDYKDFSSNGDGAIVIPYYNGSVEYNPQTGEPTGKFGVHKVTIGDRNNVPIYTKENLDNISIKDVVEQGKFTELEEISTRTMPFGMEAESPIGLYKVKGTNHYMVYTDSTAAMTKPYGTIAYATDAVSSTKGWEGSPYAKFDKAVVELLPTLEEKGFAPETVVCSDAQCAYIPEYMAKKALGGNDYYSTMKPSYVGHNVGRGYTGYAGGREMLVNMGITKDQIQIIEKDPEYIKALQEGGGAVDQYCKKYMPELWDGSSGAFSPTLIPFRYAQQGYLSSFDVVAEQYARDIAYNPKASPVLYDAGWEELYKARRNVGGILNPLNDPSLDPYDVSKLPKGAANPIAITQSGEVIVGKMVDGTPVFEQSGKQLEQSDIKKIFKQFKAFKKNGSYDEMLDVKRYNKGLIFERLSGEYKQAEVINGLFNGKPVSIIGGINPDVISRMKNQGMDPKLIISWGRADDQKGLDITIKAFQKFAKTKEGKDAVLVVGATLTGESNGAIPVIRDAIKSALNDEELKGRFVFIDGFAPAKSLSSAADVALFTSRHEPCGLTDLEAMKYFCTPIVTNTQGFAQKNFDPRILEEADKATSYKTKHEFLMSDKIIEKIKSAFAFDNQASRTELMDEFPLYKEDTSLFESFGRKYKDLLKAEQTKQEVHKIPKDNIETIVRKNVEGSEAYNKLVRDLCDGILVDETADALSTQAKQSKDIAERIFRNQVNLDTSWDGRFLHPSGMSTRELYQQRHIDPDPIMPKKSLLNFDITKELDEAAESGAKGIIKKLKNMPFAAKAAGILGIVAVAIGSVYLARKAKTNKTT